MQTLFEQYPELAKALGTTEVAFKREDMHTYGSHKGRSIPHMIDHYVALGDKKFAISSSGNAALAAALYIQELNAGKHKEQPLELDVFVGQHASPHKVEKIQALTGDFIRLYTKERPLQALTQATAEGIRSLRQSTDDTALVGYRSLAEELAQELKAGAVFMATSSGTTAQALAQYFLEKKLPIQVHVVQTSQCHPIAEAFEPASDEENAPLADAIVDHIAYRKKVLVPLIEKTGGYGWSATNENVSLAQELVHKHTDLEISPNSALSVAGAMLAIYAGREFGGSVVCVLGGE